MELLKLLENIRSDVFTSINLVLTKFGEEVVIISILALIYWCINKKLGQRIAFSYLFAGVLVNTIKILAQIPRPFVKDTSMKPVEGALKHASGYSFPSGHTQSATSLYGTLSFYYGKHSVIFSILLFLPIIIVAFTRLYLGVHTPLDVIAGFAIGIVVNLIVGYIFDNFSIDHSMYRTILIVVSIISFALMLLGIYEVTYCNVDIKNGIDCVKIGAATLGFIIGWYIEVTKIKFNEIGINLGGQILKYITGLFGVAVTYICVGSLLEYFFGEYSVIANTIPYFLTTLWISGLFPIMIKKVFTSPFNFRN